MREQHAVIPGSFDPITNGHRELIRRAAELFDRVTVLICVNSAKKGILSPEARETLVKEAIKPFSSVTAQRYEGIFADYCHESGISVVVKGVRDMNDFAYEQSLLRMNEAIFSAKGYPCPETVFIPSDPRYSYCSSTFVREMLLYGEDCSAHVPNAALLERLYREEKKE